MLIRELIEKLEEIEQTHGSEIEVRLASQPNWPFEYSIPSDAVIAVEPKDSDEFELEDEETRSDEQGIVCYIGEGTQLGYLSESATRELGWSRR